MRTKIKVDDKFPLRGYLICPECGKLLTASSSRGRKQRYHYYHCYSGCNIRFASNLVNGEFSKELAKWKPHPAVGQLYRLVLHDMHRQGDRIRQQELKRIQEEMARVSDHKTRIRKMRINNEIDTEDYAIEKKEVEENISRLDSKLASLTQMNDLQPQLQKAYNVLSNIDQVWEDKNISTEWKRNLVGSMFPEKLQFSSGGFRTARVNEVAQLIFSMGEAFSEIKMGQVETISDLSQYVDPLTHFSNRFLHDLKKLADLAA
jgi:site-specific DNA recombinase